MSINIVKTIIVLFFSLYIYIYSCVWWLGIMVCYTYYLSNLHLLANFSALRNKKNIGTRRLIYSNILELILGYVNF